MMFETMDQLHAFLTGEALLCGLLGRALFGEPDKAWLEQLIQDDLFTELPLQSNQQALERGRELLYGWARAHANGLADEEIQSLRSEQFMLLTGVGRAIAPAWESIYLSREHLIFQEQTIQVRRWYARFGLQFERLNNEPDDHIGIELSFIAHLAGLALEALADGDEARLNELLQSQRDFLSEHLLRWAPAWVNLMLEHARSDYFRGLALLTQGVLQAAAQELRIETAEKAAGEPVYPCRND